MELDKSILMQKQVRNNSEDLQSEFLDLKNWEEQMKRKERELLNEQDNQEVMPPVRSKTKKKPSTGKKLANKKPEKSSKRVKSHNSASWEKSDTDKTCKEVDSEKQSSHISSKKSMSYQDIIAGHSKANQHKVEGNKFVQQKEWNKAIASYSKAIEICPDNSIFFANRALCYLKQDNFYSAEADCSSAIELDETYVKAYHRRATARMELKQYKEAAEDVKDALVLEPFNKEVQALFFEINKQLEYSKIIISEEDLTEDIPVEKTIGEKMVDSIKPIKKEIVTEKKVKRNKAGVDSTVESTTASITKLKLDPSIPDWLPEKDNVAIVRSIAIPPHLHSKEPLRRIPVQEADLTKPLKREDQAELSGTDTHSADTAKHTEIVKKNKENSSDSCTELSPVPKTAIQFLIDWKKYKSFDFRYKYLKQLIPESLPDIFQSSMEIFIFIDILATLRIEFVKREEPIFPYLKSLSNIKRFRAFIKFMTEAEKQDLKFMFSYCETSEKVSDKEVAELQTKYEI